MAGLKKKVSREKRMELKSSGKNMTKKYVDRDGKLRVSHA